MVHGDRQKALLRYSSLAVLVVLASACSKGAKAPSGALSEATLSAAQIQANQAMASAAATLNQTDQYSLTEEDLALLNSEGLIDANEKSTLSLFAKN